MPRAKVLPVPARPTTTATPAPPWQRSRTIACWSAPAVGWAARAPPGRPHGTTTAVCSPVRPVAAATSRCSTASSSGVDQRRSSSARSATTLTARSAKNRSASPSSSPRVAPASWPPRAARTSWRAKVDAVRGQPVRTGQPVEHRGHRLVGHRPVLVAGRVSGRSPAGPGCPGRCPRSAASVRHRPYRVSGASCSLGLRVAWTAHLTSRGVRSRPSAASRSTSSVDLVGALGEQPDQLLGQALELPVAVASAGVHSTPSVRTARAGRWPGRWRPRPADADTGPGRPTPSSVRPAPGRGWPPPDGCATADHPPGMSGGRTRPPAAPVRTRAGHRHGRGGPPGARPGRPTASANPA